MCNNAYIFGTLRMGTDHSYSTGTHTLFAPFRSEASHLRTTDMCTGIHLILSNRHELLFYFFNKADAVLGERESVFSAAITFINFFCINRQDNNCSLVSSYFRSGDFYISSTLYSNQLYPSLPGRWPPWMEPTVVILVDGETIYIPTFFWFYRRWTLISKILRYGN